MSKEGEFKKRIKKISWKEVGGSNKNGEASTDCCCRYIDVLKIVDEASKEFPDWDKLARTDEGKKALEMSEYQETFDALYQDKVEQWRVKWLGKPKRQGVC